VLDQLSDYLDEEARAELVLAVDAHLGHCTHCQVEVDSMQRTIAIYRREERVVLPVSLCDKLQKALDQAYRVRARGIGR
jgi:anti-sigma factor RsiW